MRPTSAHIGQAPRPGQNARSDAISPLQIRRQLSRILASRAFRDSLRLTSFLTFVVETTLAGKGASLKAYTIAIEALGRDPSFDPQDDPIVRVGALRLRLALTRYYSGEGRNDPIIIALPRGRYVPVFQSRNDKVAVSPNAFAPADHNADLLNDALFRLTDLCRLLPHLLGPAREMVERARPGLEPAATNGWHVDAVRLLGHQSANRESPAAADSDRLTIADARAVRLIATLDELIAQLLAAHDLKSAVETILDAAMRLHGASFGNVQLLDEQSHELFIYAQRGFRRRFLKTFERVAADDGCACGRALRDRTSIIVPDVEADPGFDEVRDVIAEAGFRAVQSTPLITGSGKVVGMVSTHFARPHRPSELAMLITRFYGRLAADLIERLAHGQNRPAAEASHAA